MDGGMMDHNSWDNRGTYGTEVGHQNADGAPIVLYCPIDPILFKKNNIFIEMYIRSLGMFSWDRTPSVGRSL